MALARKLIKLFHEGRPWRGELAAMELSVNAADAESALDAAFKQAYMPAGLARRAFGLDDLDAMDEASRRLRAKAEDDGASAWAGSADGGAWAVEISFACDLYGDDLHSYAIYATRLEFVSARPHQAPDASDGDEGRWRALRLAIDEAAERRPPPRHLSLRPPSSAWAPSSELR